MNVKVERCVNSRYRVSRDGKQLMVRGDLHGDWTRAVATEAKRLVQQEWGLEPEKIRFV